MSDELDEIVDNITERSFWVRILFVVAFGIASYIILVPLIFVLSIAQALFTLFTGQSNANLRYFSATLALYVPQVIEFLTYVSEVKPYPFSDLPEVEDSSLQEKPPTKNSADKSAAEKTEAASPADAETTAAKKAVKKKAAPKTAKKKAARKKVAKKKAAKKSSATETDAGSEDVSDS